ncbi:prolipoprotein diacylglyceryl transferase [Hyphomicrobium sp. NDB2Meth4]|uniref:prolipoprotein diacylglyceryl transferase n=1 Tax=Hyphomicrobium sp. NDB2Meth4 TaxID=1892846 RepID=UPI0032AFD3D7
MLTTLWAIPFPNLDPVALQIGPVAIKWYGLAYLAGLLLGWLYIRRLLSTPYLWAKDTPPFTPAKVDDLLLYITAGVVLGGRLGFVIFYEPSYYIANPQDIIAVWKGGMAFHGALVGCAIAIWAFAHRNNVSPWSTGDLVTAAVPIGLFFGRIANFINGELFGRPTTMPWGMVFPEAAIHYPQVEPTPRHPSQLYEAALEGLLLFLVLRLLTHHFGALKRPGLVSGTFLIGYALARSTGELFREPHFAHAFNIGPLTAGIAYSIPMFILGIVVVRYALSRSAK